MDTVKEFINDLKERLSNPLVSSFVISWLVSNWTISVTLLFYSPQDLKADGYKSYIHVIEQNSNWWLSFVLPLIVALVYTFAFPYIKAWIRLLHAKITAKNETDILYATQAGTMPNSKYIKLVEQYKEDQSKLQDLIKTESEKTVQLLQASTTIADRDAKIAEQAESLITLNESIKSSDTAIADLKRENENLGKISEAKESNFIAAQRLLDSWITWNDVAFLNGNWNVRNTLSDLGREEEYVRIENGSFVSDRYGTGEIIDYLANPRTSKVTFTVITRRDNNIVYSVYNLKKSNQMMIGKKDNIINVEFRNADPDF